MVPVDFTCRTFTRGLHSTVLLACASLGILLLGGCMEKGPTRAMIDRTRDGVPAHAIAQAERAVHRPVAVVWDWPLDFSSRRVYAFFTSASWERRDPSVLLTQKGNRFVEVNSREGLPVLREIMQDYRLARKDFEDRRKLTDFCEYILYLSGLPHGYVLGCDHLLKEIEQDPNGVAFWAGRAADESVFRHLCHDPDLAIDRNDWVAVFNVLAPYGSAELWRVSGVWDPRTQTNTIEKIERFPLFNRGTFNCVLIGG